MRNRISEIARQIRATNIRLRAAGFILSLIHIFVALAPEGLGGEIGGVGFDHDPVHGQPVNDFQGLAGIFIGDGAGEGQHP